MGTHRLRGGPLALVPSSSPHFPAPPHLLPKETMPINNFCLVDKPPHPTCSPRVMPANPNPAVTWELRVPDYSSLGSLNKVLLEGRGGSAHSGAHCPFWRLQDKWHCLDKLEVTSLGSLSQCQCGQALGRRHALAVGCPQRPLPNPWLLPPSGGRGKGGWGAQGNKTGQEAQAGGGHSGPGTNSQHRKPQPTPAHPTRPKLWERGAAKSLVPPTGARAQG